MKLMAVEQTRSETIAEVHTGSPEAVWGAGKRTLVT